MFSRPYFMHTSFNTMFYVEKWKVDYHSYAFPLFILQSFTVYSMSLWPGQLCGGATYNRGHFTVYKIMSPQTLIYTNHQPTCVTADCEAAAVRTFGWHVVYVWSK